MPAGAAPTSRSAAGAAPAAGRCNDIGQRYHGPVVLITSARCYSTTDFFAAGFQDHGIGPVLGVDDNTGAGGANVWTHELVRQLVPGSPLQRLPRNAGMRVAIRRSLRVGRQVGTELEDLGVVPDHLHRMTRRDILEGNPDLIEAAAAILSGLTSFRLDAQASRVGTSLQVNLTTAGLDRVDFAVDGRPVSSIDTRDGASQATVAAPQSHGSLLLSGYKSRTLSAARQLQF